MERLNVSLNFVVKNGEGKETVSTSLNLGEMKLEDVVLVESKLVGFMEDLLKTMNG